MSEAEKHAFTLPLADVRATLERVGGKGASLARLLRAGLPVPDGFHVTTAAYRDFVDANNIQALIETALHLVDVRQPHTLGCRAPLCTPGSRPADCQPSHRRMALSATSTASPAMPRMRCDSAFA